MFTDEELYEILRILAVVLHLGNIQYVGKYSSEVLEKNIGESFEYEFYRNISRGNSTKIIIISWVRRDTVCGC